MRNRFRRKLYELLQKDNISLESGIVNDVIYRMAGITLANRDNANYTFPGFQLQASSGKNEDLKFSLAQLTMEELVQLLKFFKIDERKYVTDLPLTLSDESFVFKTLLPAFTAYYNCLKAANDPLFIKYQIKSKPILESTAINTLREYTQQALNILIKDSIPENIDLMNALFLLKSNINELGTHPILYKQIIATKARIEELRQKNTDLELDKPLGLILEGVDLFTRYNRYESVLAIKSFNKEVESFLNSQYKVSAKSCDVVEETLIKIIGVQLGKEGKCEVEQGYDQSRMVFNFTDMSKDSAAVVVKYFQDIGDKTATEGYGYRHYGSPAPESYAKSRSMQGESSYNSAPKDPLETHSIEIDGKFFYETLFPLLKKQLESVDADTMKCYQKASETCLAEKTAAEPAAANRHAMFQRGALKVSNPVYGPEASNSLK